MAPTINCWQCGNRLIGLILPLSRREECANCGAEQHVCKLCKEYNPNTSRSCDEELAEDVKDKEAANFCDYFSPNPHAHTASKQTKKKHAENELAKLFGDIVDDEDSIEPLDQPVSQSQKALSELDKLFGDPPAKK